MNSPAAASARRVRETENVTAEGRIEIPLGYRYCPLCRTELRPAQLDGVTRLKCPADGCTFVHYRNPAPAAGIILVEEHRVLLVCRAHEPRRGYWSLPAGFMEWDEHPRQTAVRESREETGLHVELTGLFDIYSGSDDPRTRAVLTLYEAKRIGGELLAGDDASEVAFFPLIDLPEMIAFHSHREALRDYARRYTVPSDTRSGG